MILVALATFTAFNLPNGIVDGFGQGTAMARAQAERDAHVARDDANRARTRVVTFRVKDLDRCKDGARYLTTYDPGAPFRGSQHLEPHLERLTDMPVAIPCSPEGAGR